MGHNNRVCSVCFSHLSYPPTSPKALNPSNQPLLLSASADGSARLWQQSKMDSPLVVFSHHKHQPASSSSSSTVTSNCLLYINLMIS